ncbi:uncharacterized protein LOC108135065 [Drosophila elegans]|nr:uncharacterized protein LOC108135065 [Drosophila elegans]
MDEAPRRATAIRSCIIVCLSFGFPSTCCCFPWPRLFSSSA